MALAIGAVALCRNLDRKLFTFWIRSESALPNLSTPHLLTSMALSLQLGKTPGLDFFRYRETQVATG
jgi:hypothetical protein